MESKRTALRVFDLQLHGIKVLHTICPHLYLLLFLRSLFNGLAPYVPVFFFARILIELTLGSQPEVLGLWTAAGVLAMGISQTLKSAVNRRYDVMCNAAFGRKEMLFCRKAFAMDYADLESPEIRDLRIQLDQNENWTGWGLIQCLEITEHMTESLMGIAGGTALTISLFTALVPESGGWLTVLNHPVFIVLFACALLSICLVSGRMAEVKMAGLSSIARESRLANQIFSVFGFIGQEKSRSVDIRMYEQEKLVVCYWKGSSRLLGADSALSRLFLGRVGALYALSQSSVALTTGAVYLYTCLKAIGGAIGVGSISQYVGAVSALSLDLTMLLESYGNMKANAPYLKETFRYLDLPNMMHKGDLPLPAQPEGGYEVEFENVSFKYPGSDSWALRHVSLKIKAGHRLAIVGENGSGKTTLIKLLSRLYDPQEGRILLNGTDISQYCCDEYMDLLSVVFQDFELLCQPLGANIAACRDYDIQRAEKALADAGFENRLEQLPKGLDTVLYKDLSDAGVEVSGGEAQKIAIARALYKDAPFIILDEPTASLDPLAEAEIYAKFNEMTADRTAIYISHRLSSCQFCDEIAVFDNGSIVQTGRHEVLVKDENRKYFELWNAQAQYYTEQL